MPKPSCRAVAAIQQILERDTHALMGLFSLDLAGEPGCIYGHRIHWYVADQFMNESLATLPAFLQLGAINAVRQLHHGDDGKADLQLAVCRVDLFQDLTDCVALPLSRDHDGRVEDQSHAGGFQGFRLRMISSISTAKSGSNAGLWPVSSSWAFASAMHSESVRRAGTAGRITATG